MSYELKTIADCWVYKNKPDTNFNKDLLAIGRWNYLSRSLITFDLRNVNIDPATIKAAELLLYGKALYTPLIVEALYTATGWSETTVTWNNQPPPTTYHWEGGDTSLMGSTTQIPSASAGWYSIPLEVAFIKHRWNQKLHAILKGYETAANSYCYAQDKEASGGTYAPRLILHTEPVGIPTTTTISAPATVKPNETFTITGRLSETDTNISIPNQPITLSYNGITLGTAQTNVNGDYQIQVFIPTEGTYTLTAHFAGTTTLAASTGTTKTSTAPTSALLPIAVLATLAYAFLKK